MLAFHSDPKLKAFVLRQLRAHRAADTIIKGTYWSDGKGCAVGCTLDAVRKRAGLDALDHGKHALYETQLGIPVALAHLEDRIFEGLPNAVAAQWPLDFTKAIRSGSDLSMVVPRFLYWLLSERVQGRVNKAEHPQAWQVIADVAALYRRWCEGKKPTRAEFSGAADYAANAARSARSAHAADYAADYAANAAAYAADAARYAANAANAADYAARSAANAADAADAADAARSARSAARSAEYEVMAAKLLELLKAA